MNTAAASTRTMLLGAMCLLPACSVGPDYVRPDSPAPAAFKELQGWQPAQPQDQLGRGPWWKMFGDPLLDELEQQVEISNLNVAIASAQFRAAKALVQQTRAGRLPTVTADASVDRSRGPVGTGNRVIGSANQATSYSAALDASWELDVWGRVRRSVEANEAGAQASAADLESARLSAQATLAGDFWLLRAVDAQKQLLDDTVTAYQRSLQMVTNRNVQGVASKGEVVQAQTQLESVRAQALDLGVQRAQLEHAIAVLIGKPPAELTIVPAPLGTKVPQVPVGLPSQLLERRPDVAAAERRVAAASARIGVAAAAFYPALTLSGSAGYRSTDLTHWITAPAR
ncbi:MAG TPA: efflux transporter outer membrane subunit, partial [Planctomycetota bacterium]|nr:efflux transporter outer membrane subunit [Planctomycetota bacterium]